jgi:hypothetical protein
VGIRVVPRRSAKKTIIVRRIYKTIKTPVYGDVPNPQFAGILDAARLYAAC